MIVFDGEFINAETQETTPINGSREPVILRLLRKMKDGDALVVNAREEKDWQ